MANGSVVHRRRLGRCAARAPSVDPLLAAAAAQTPLSTLARFILCIGGGGTFADGEEEAIAAASCVVYGHRRRLGRCAARAPSVDPLLAAAAAQTSVNTLARFIVRIGGGGAFHSAQWRRTPRRCNDGVLHAPCSCRSRPCRGPCALRRPPPRRRRSPDLHQHLGHVPPPSRPGRSLRSAATGEENDAIVATTPLYRT
jgi:hypothetical protein